MAQDISSATSVSSVHNLDQEFNNRQQGQDRAIRADSRKNLATIKDESRNIALKSRFSQNNHANPLDEKLQTLSKNLREHSQQESEETKEMLEDIRQSLNVTLEPINIKLDFSENEDIEEMVVEVMNRETEEIIRQIPPEAMIHMAKRMEEMTGLLVDERM